MSVYDRLISEFGTEILINETDDTDDGCISNNAGEGTEKSSERGPPEIDRRKLGDVVFRDRQKRRKLDSITHPAIIKIMLTRILLEGLNISFGMSNNATIPRKGKKRLRVVCVDIPLLFEGGLPMRLLFGTIIVVACNPTLQLARLRERNPDLSEEQCRQRIASQIPVEEKAKRADVVIRNDGDLDLLKRRVRDVREEVATSASKRGVELSWSVIGIGLGAIISLKLWW